MRRMRLTAGCRHACQLLLAAAPALVFTVHISGCTVAATLTGAVIDDLRRDRTPSSVVTIRRDANVELRLWDGRSLRGRFEGRHEMSPEAYTQEWASWRDSTKRTLQLPSPGDSVLLTRSGGAICSGRLVAYRIDAVVVSSSGADCIVPLEAIVSLADASGRPVEILAMRRAARRATIPLTTLIRLRRPTGMLDVPLHMVRYVEGPSPREFKVFGFIIGLGADIVLVALAAESRNSGSGCEGGDYSGGGFGY